MDYLQDYKYNVNPVIVVSLDQVIRFSNWRSDRVFEGLLIRYEIIEINRNANPKNVFTKDRYLRSKLGVENKDLVTHFPLYFVPEFQDWQVVKDKIESNVVKVKMIIFAGNAKSHQAENGIPFVPIKNVEGKMRDGVLYNILGNVSEILNEPNRAIGGSYKDDLTTILKFEETEYTSGQQDVGFRNFC